MNRRRRLNGTVVSNKMDKTVVVRVDRTYRHPLYGKVIRSSKKFMAHDEDNVCEIGDLVVIVESRPLSRHKRWFVQEILRHDELAGAEIIDTGLVEQPSPTALEGEAGVVIEETPEAPEEVAEEQAAVED